MGPLASPTSTCPTSPTATIPRRASALMGFACWLFAAGSLPRTSLCRMSARTCSCGTWPPVAAPRCLGALDPTSCGWTVVEPTVMRPGQRTYASPPSRACSAFGVCATPGPRTLSRVAKKPGACRPESAAGLLSHAALLFTHHGRRLGQGALRIELDRAAADAGLGHITTHQLRHTFATAMVNAGVSLQALMALLGHVSAEMSLRYGRLFRHYGAC